MESTYIVKTIFSLKKKVENPDAHRKTVTDFQGLQTSWPKNAEKHLNHHASFFVLPPKRHQNGIYRPL